MKWHRASKHDDLRWPCVWLVFVCLCVCARKRDKKWKEQRKKKVLHRRKFCSFCANAKCDASCWKFKWMLSANYHNFKWFKARKYRPKPIMYGRDSKSPKKRVTWPLASPSAGKGGSTSRGVMWSVLMVCTVAIWTGAFPMHVCYDCNHDFVKFEFKFLIYLKCKQYSKIHFLLVCRAINLSLKSRTKDEFNLFSLLQFHPN